MILFADSMELLGSNGFWIIPLIISLFVRGSSFGGDAETGLTFTVTSSRSLITPSSLVTVNWNPKLTFSVVPEQ